MKSGNLGRWSRGFTVASVAFLVAWQVAALAGVPRSVEVALGVHGFVLHMVFGKAYTLVPSYFDRELAVPGAAAVHLPLSVLGAAGLAAAPLTDVPVGVAGSVAWTGGVAVFLFAILWTVRGNLGGTETGTSDVNRHRRRVDRLANAAVPVVLAYLAVGAYETLAGSTGLPPLVGGGPRTAHLLAAGTGALLVFAVGFRLLPRFLAADPPTALVAVVLPAGAVGPLLLATDFWGGRWFRAGAVLQAVAVVGFAAAFVVLFVRSDRRRVGVYAVLLGVLAGVSAVALGLTFAFGEVGAWAPTAHFRLNVLGFLGLTIVGVAYQFYPPAVGTFPGAGDRTALASIGLLGGGLAVQVVGMAWRPWLATAGEVLTLAGALAYGTLLVGLFYQRYRRR